MYAGRTNASCGVSSLSLCSIMCRIIFLFLCPIISVDKCKESPAKRAVARWGAFAGPAYQESQHQLWSWVKS